MEIKDLHWQVITAYDLLCGLKSAQVLIRAIKHELDGQDRLDVNAVLTLLFLYRDETDGKIKDALSALDLASEELRKLRGQT